ncbi:MAG: hypothetical protein ACTHPS_20975 [Streptosporangiaceae bacterium]
MFPLDSRLTGGQIVGLAVLAAGFTITIARLSVRRPGPLPQAAFAPGTLPALPSPVANPGPALPKISPGPKASPSPAPAGVSGASGLFPLDSGQIIGLAVLAAGLIITVARFLVRGPRRQRSRSPPAG